MEGMEKESATGMSVVTSGFEAAVAVPPKGCASALEVLSDSEMARGIEGRGMSGCWAMYV